MVAIVSERIVCAGRAVTENVASVASCVGSVAVAAEKVALRCTLVAWVGMSVV